MYIKPIMSRVPTRVGGGGGLTLVIILVLMMCASVIVGAGGYVLFKPKTPAEKAKAADDTGGGNDTEEETPAAVNCVGTWSDWDGCSETCGGGIQAKEWTTTTEPLHGGTACPSPSTETQACNEQACPIGTRSDGTDGFDNETFYIKDVEDRYVGAYGARNIMGHGYWYPKASYTLDGSLDETTIQSGGKYCLGFDNRINCSGGSGDDRGNFKLEKQSDGGFKIYNEGLGAYIGLTKDVLYKEIDKAKYPDDKQNMILYLERVP